MILSFLFQLAFDIVSSLQLLMNSTQRIYDEAQHYQDWNLCWKVIVASSSRHSDDNRTSEFKSSIRVCLLLIFTLSKLSVIISCEARCVTWIALINRRTFDQFFLSFFILLAGCRWIRSQRWSMALSARLSWLRCISWLSFQWVSQTTHVIFETSSVSSLTDHVNQSSFSRWDVNCV